MKTATEPAYPTLDKMVTDGVDQGLELKHPGLTKREYFAGLAMQGLSSNSFYAQHVDGDVNMLSSLAKRSTEIADELLKQLEQ